MTCSAQAKLSFREHCLNTDRLGTVQDFYVGDSILPADASNGAEGTQTKHHQLFDESVAQGSRLTPVEKRSEDHGTVDSVLWIGGRWAG